MNDKPHRKGPPSPGETRKLTRDEFKYARLDSGVDISCDEKGKVHFSRKKRHGYGKTYTEKEFLKAEKRLLEFWAGQDLYTS